MAVEAEILACVSLAIRSLGLSDELVVGELLDLFDGEWSNALAPGASGVRAFLADSRNFMRPQLGSISLGFLACNHRR